MQTLVSCIMPVTADRAAYLPYSVQCFRAQTYANVELVIVCDQGDREGLPKQERSIRILRVPPGRTIGYKRNIACAAAYGEYIAHWDSDDWYHSTRIEQQQRFHVEAGVNLTGISPIRFLNEATGDVWIYDDLDFACDTSRFYRRSYWDTCNFLDANDDQDIEFWTAACGSRKVLRQAGLIVAGTHPGNTSPRPHLESGHWHRVKPDAVTRSIRFS